ncbi:unnamed protein product [Hermetia illucens]|uniref:Uncharacterized protein n=1 Tax=Hermetia illucens TaxID=343691 RepID=A0A7R8YZS3_HERIL|nr:unnamed protein product [Hermetia illucens]
MQPLKKRPDKALAELTHQNEKLKALFGITPNEEIPSPAAHNGVIRDAIASIPSNSAPEEFTHSAPRSLLQHQSLSIQIHTLQQYHIIIHPRHTGSCDLPKHPPRLQF